MTKIFKSFTEVIILSLVQRKTEGLPTVTLRSTKVIVVNDDDSTSDGCKGIEGYNRNYMMCSKPDPDAGTITFNLC